MWGLLLPWRNEKKGRIRLNRISINFRKELEASGLYDEVARLNAYVGDIHNHSGISYGYGRIEDAIAFAREQLDFFSVTGHFAWPDMDEEGKNIPEDVKEYHRKGFAKLRKNWPHYLECMTAAESDSFIPFPSYEYHSFIYGDYTILCKNRSEPLPDPVAEGEEDRRLINLINADESQREHYLCTPHHIGYKEGWRGISWSHYREEPSPLVEIISMHGCSESYEAVPKYLHTMGPRSEKNTYQGGLQLGKHFGVVGSTDHHNSAPGSYGFGRTVLYAESLSRDSVWNALNDRATTAASGDPIETALFVNGVRSGHIAPKHDGKIHAEAFVAAYDRLEKVELIQDGRVIAGKYNFESDSRDEGKGFISFMFGWGKKHKSATLDVELSVDNGSVLSVTPRLRGIDMVDPLDVPADGSAVLPHLVRNDNGVSLHVVTDGNATAQTDSSNGFVLEVDGSDDTVITLKAKVCWSGRTVEREYRYTLAELREEQTSEYVDGFVSPAVEIGRFVPVAETVAHLDAYLEAEDQGAIYLRAYEKHGDAVFTSPVSFR